ncbi:response regulator [Paracoccus sp. TOH]|uniref:Response regulator n=1 Tax=Paracoccus simplex TaxID=2086346 RepID=A0ABV7RX23_9RHOB|nr:response regulator [Paracoccus sp. TOH]WJS85524.1 response regulator [Paracoccus sp. TOH]
MDADVDAGVDAGAGMALTVLVLHASADLRERTAGALRQAGMAVALSGDGSEGLALLQDRRVDAIITGIALPGLDGFGFIEAVRRQERLRAVPILVLSTATLPELKSRARNAGAAGWLPQPFDARQLVASVRAVTG